MSEPFMQAVRGLIAAAPAFSSAGAPPIVLVTRVTTAAAGGRLLRWLRDAELWDEVAEGTGGAVG
jgi:hypothetical protein